MIVFNSVRITQDNGTLIIDAEINHSQYFKKMYITNVWIDNQDTYFQNGPSDNPVYHKKIEPTVDENGIQSFNRSIYLAIDRSEIRGSLLNNMLFVYIGVDGIPDPDTPCGLDKNIWLKVTMNTYPLYKKLMQEFTNVSNTCIIPPGLIDTILRIEALDASIKTGNNLIAIDLWNNYFKNIPQTTPTNCNCNGNY